MKLKIVFSIVAMAAAMTASTPAFADIVTFNSTATPQNGLTGDGNTYTEAGLIFTSNFNGGLFHYGTSLDNNPDPSGVTLLQRYQGGIITVVGVGNNIFDLNSIDIANYQGSQILQSGAIFFSYTINGVKTDVILNLQPATPFNRVMTFNLNLLNVSQFTFTQDVQNGPGFQLDNIVFTPHVAAVPEPATWGMMILGFGVVGGAMRRRWSSAKVALA